ncbi:hypothetical protein KL907_000027 [Ogataea polymorpha]|nr:hypothetical protein KL907_000027 [Ogataea polymorpha]
MDVLEKGLQLFERGKYQEAHCVLSKAVDLAQEELKKGQAQWRSKLGLLLDSRAACNQKLGDLDAALQDARQQMALEPYKCKSYLRASKIHVLAGRDKDALDVLETGVRRLERGKTKYGSRLQINERLFNKMTAEIEELRQKTFSDPRAKRRRVKSYDPLDYLPFELQATIFSHLDQPSLMNCLLVSRRWKQTLENLPTLLHSPVLKRHLSLKEFVKFLNFCRTRQCRSFENLSLSPRAVEESSMLKQLLSSGFQVKRLNLSLAKYDNFELAKLLSSIATGRRLFAGLEELSLSLPVVENGAGLTDLLGFLGPNITKLNIVITNLVVSKLVRREPSKVDLPRLSRLVIMAYPKLHEKLNRRLMRVLFENFTIDNVQSLHLINCDMEAVTMEKVLQGLEKLEHFSADSCGALILGDYLRFLSRNGVPLESLAVRESALSRPSSSVSDIDLRFLWRLKSLSLENTSLNFQQLFLLLQSTNHQLRHLKLKANYKLIFMRSAFDIGIPNATTLPVNFREFLQCVPKLESLALIQCTNLTDSALRSLSAEMVNTSCPKGLKLLDLSANEVSGVGIIDLFQRPKSWLRLDQLLAHGCDLHPDTLSLLVRRGYCGQIQSLA